MIPEEVNFSPTNDYIISVESRNRERGMTILQEPDRFYINISNNKPSISNEVGILEVPVRGCYFVNEEIDVINWREDG